MMVIRGRKKEEKVAVQPERILCAIVAPTTRGIAVPLAHVAAVAKDKLSSCVFAFFFSVTLLPVVSGSGKVVPSGPESLARNSFHRPNERFQPSAPLVHTWATLVLRFSECRSRGGSIESLVRTCCRMFHNGTSFSKISSFCRCTYLC